MGNQLIGHCLDVMHIEKNFSDHVLYTLLNDPTKSKDNLKVPNNVTTIIVELYFFFWHICGKSLIQIDLDKLHDRMIQTLYHLEMLFPPTFFTIIVHLTCHLTGEAKLGGPVHYRWMYPNETKMSLTHLSIFS